LEAILLSSVNEFLSYFDGGNHWITSGGSCRHIVPTGDCYFNIEVDEASSAPTKIILGEVVTHTITDEALLFALFYLVNIAIKAQKNFNGSVFIFRFNSKSDSAGESVRGILWYIVFEKIG
jgi:hypothetical protein